jgi:hypothetical protein
MNKRLQRANLVHDITDEFEERLVEEVDAAVNCRGNIGGWFFDIVEDFMGRGIRHDTSEITRCVGRDLFSESVVQEQHTFVPSMVPMACFSVCMANMSSRGKEQHTSACITIIVLGSPFKIASLNKYSPPAVPRA